MLFNSKKDLFKFLTNKIDKANGLIAIQAGHFALIGSEKNSQIVPAIFEDIKDKEQRKNIKSHPYMGHFPLTTWKLGIDLAKYALEKNKEVNLVILVNDWQWTPKVGFGENNKFTDEYYKNAKLPASYERVLTKNNISKKLILPLRNKDNKANNPYFFSEKRLRNQFSNYYSNQCELNNECAQEYIPLLLQLNQEKVELFISFIPKTCMKPINMGSQKGKEDYDVQMGITNVFATGIYRDNFWKNVEITEV